MPGIVGLITNMPRERAELELARMLGTFRHESFYRTGVSVDASLGVCRMGRAGELVLGRHAASKRTRRRRPHVLGEEFPEPGTARRLLDRGHSFDSAGAEYLVHLYEEDASFPAGLNGRFHGLAYRSRARIDVAVQRPLRSAATLRSTSRKTPSISPPKPKRFWRSVRSCGASTRRGWVSSSPAAACSIRSLFRAFPSCRAVQRGRSARRGRTEGEGTSNRGSGRIRASSRPTLLSTAPATPSRRNLPRYSAREPVGMSLTGGLDTRMIMAWHKAAPGSLPAPPFGSTSPRLP